MRLGRHRAGPVAIAMKAAIAALQGKVMPQSISLPLPRSRTRTSRTATNFYPKLSDNFFVGNDFPPCGINLKAQDIMGKAETNN